MGKKGNEENALGVGRKEKKGYCAVRLKKGHVKRCWEERGSQRGKGE